MPGNQQVPDHRPALSATAPVSEADVGLCYERLLGPHKRWEEGPCVHSAPHSHTAALGAGEGQETGGRLK